MWQDEVIEKVEEEKEEKEEEPDRPRSLQSVDRPFVLDKRDTKFIRHTPNARRLCEGSLITRGDIRTVLFNQPVATSQYTHSKALAQHQEPQKCRAKTIFTVNWIDSRRLIKFEMNVVRLLCPRRIDTRHEKITSSRWSPVRRLLSIIRAS